MTGKGLVAPVLLLLACSAPGFSGILYSSGGILGSENAYFIDGPGSGPFSQTISDLFTATNTGIADSLDVGLWVTAGSTPTRLSWSLGTTAFGSEISSGTVPQVDYVFFGHRDVDVNVAYDIFSVHVSGLTGFLNAGSTYYLTLADGNDSLNDQLVAWDVNNGSSTCNFAVSGVPSGGCGPGQAFTINSSSATPEPASILLLLLGSGMLAMAGILRRRTRA